MNYIAGLIDIVIKEEHEEFALLVSLIREMKMEKLFSDGIPLIRCKLFQMDRLLHLHLPKFAEFLRMEGIVSNAFCSTWIITLFTFSLEDSKDGKSLDLLIAIWDCFVMDGWKAFFKICLYFLKKYEDQLLELPYDCALRFLNDLPKKTDWFESSAAKNLKEGILKIKVTNKMLLQLENEYYKIIERPNDSI